MAEPANERGPLETLSLAGIGAIALVAQHADELAAEIGNRLGVERDEVRDVIADVLDSWRREATRLGESGGSRGSACGVRARRGVARGRRATSSFASRSSSTASSCSSATPAS